MEALDDSNCHSLSDSFSLYERYMRSFSRLQENQDSNHIVQSRSVENLIQDNVFEDINSHDINHGNIDASNVQPGNILNKYEDYILNQNYNVEEISQQSDKNVDNSVHSEYSLSNCESYMDKSELIDLPVSSEDTKSNNSSAYIPKPVVITSLITMDNSNNAMDSVPLFCDVRTSETVFKLPITELSFNGTIKHVQKLKPMVDPITVLTSVAANNNNECSEELNKDTINLENENIQTAIEECETAKDKSNSNDQYSDVTEKSYTRVDDSMDVKSTLDRSSSSLETSFDSGVRSPDMFSEDDEETAREPVENFWNFTQKFETEERTRVKKIEEVIRGVLPPPSVTMLQTNVTEMLNKYYCFLPVFTNTDPNPKTTLSTPTKGVSYVKIPDIGEQVLKTTNDDSIEKSNLSSIEMCSENEVKEAAWPEVLKCKYHNVHYNLTNYSEKLELLSMKYSSRYVGAETASSVTVFSGSLPSPSSAGKRKMLRMKLAQGKSPGRRLSHLARRRQAFCNAATISEKVQASTSKMVLIDKNYFPHKKLTYSSERKLPRTKRTPGRKTPGRKTPGKRTPCKTPKTRSGEGSKKKAMRRLLLDTETLSRTQPSKETFKRALFISPDNRKSSKEAPCTSTQAVLKSRQALFFSPTKTGETKSLDGTPSDNFLKRKRDYFDSGDDSRSKIAKSLSFGGDQFASGSQSFSSSQSFTRRASEFQQKSMAELNELHKQKLLWAVSEALRGHGWRMGSAGFREKASALARLTRRLLALPQHAARLQHPTLSTSDTLLKLARQYVFAIIQGRSVEECFQEEQQRLANEARGKVTGYITEAAYQQLKASKIKENTCDCISKKDLPRSASKNVLQDKLVNVNSNSSSSGFGAMEKAALFKSNSMPSFNDEAKMRARRQISFDNIVLPKR